MSFCGEVRYAIVRTRDRWHAQLVHAGAGWADRGSGRCGDRWPWSWLCRAAYGLADRVCRVCAWALYQVLTAVASVVRCVFWIPCRLFGGPKVPDGKIKHVFVLVMENRSFDHMLGLSTGTADAGLGFRPGVGIDALTGLRTTVDGPSASDGNRGFRVRAGAPLVMPVDPPHEFCDVQLQLASVPITGTPHGDKCHCTGSYPPLTMDGFVDSYANQVEAENNAAASQDLGAVLACFTGDQVPVLSTLAREFALCDNWFSSLPGPTWPNRLFLHAATSGGLDRSPDVAETVGSEVDGYKFENGTIYDALDRRGYDWRVYHGDALPQIGALAGMNRYAMAAHFHGVDELAADLRDPDFSAAYVFVEPSYGHAITHGQSFQCGNSQHPIDDVTRGEALIKYVYESLRQSPHWESSLLVVTYDEHGGFYDHVAPPSAVPPGDVCDPANTRHGFRFDRLGVRVPAVVVSPWIPAVPPGGPDDRNCNLVDHTRYDHASLLATVERLYGLPSLTARDAGADDFRHLLSADTPRDAPLTLPAPHPPELTCGDDRRAGPPAPAAAADRPLTPTLRGFVQVAALHDARLHPAERERIAEQVGRFRTVGEAHAYLARVTSQLRAVGVRTDIAAPPLPPPAAAAPRRRRRRKARRKGRRIGLGRPDRER
ncbi:alkaline phosphatase family protein [Kitasatospora sp. NPDC092948]|uniref:alkaline phosphatase family protein n=1 Tax=Kitasatospora sp. NPDC092948 TaxID=3364088 RepID=UPI0038209D3E